MLSESKEIQNLNNVFAFNKDGEFLWRKGMLTLTIANRKIDASASYIKKDINNSIKLYYQSDHEVWLDPKTGEKIKEEFVFKK